MRAVIPARRSWFVLLFLCFWLVGWAFGEVTVARQLLSPSEKAPDPFLYVWLVGWSLGGVFALVTILWQLAGKEIIAVSTGALVHRKEIFGLGRSWRYKISEVKNFRALEPEIVQSVGRSGGTVQGPIAFDYGARTIRIGASLDAAEGRMLVEKLAARLPRSLR